MTENDFKQLQLQRKSDELFAACLHFLLDRSEKWLSLISKLSQELLDAGYETSFEHRRKALVVKAIFSRMDAMLSDVEALDRVPPRLSDVEGLEASDGTR